MGLYKNWDTVRTQKNKTYKHKHWRVSDYHGDVSVSAVRGSCIAWLYLAGLGGVPLACFKIVDATK